MIYFILLELEDSFHSNETREKFIYLIGSDK